MRSSKGPEVSLAFSTLSVLLIILSTCVHIPFALEFVRENWTLAKQKFNKKNAKALTMKEFSNVSAKDRGKSDTNSSYLFRVLSFVGKLDIKYIYIAGK